MGKKILKNRLKFDNSSNDRELENEDIDDSFRLTDIEPEEINKNKIAKPLAIVSIILLILISTIFVITKFYKTPKLPFFSEENKYKEKPLAETDLEKEIPDYKSENIHLKRGIESYYKKYYNDAVAEFNEVLESDSPDQDKAKALTYLGIMEDEKNNFTRALDFYSRALKYNEKDPIIYRNISIAYRHQGKLDEALLYADKAIKLAPENINNLMLKGHIYYFRKEYSKAIETYREALKIDKENAAITFNIGQSLYKQGDRLNSIEYFKRATSMDTGGKISHLAYSKLGLFSYEDALYDDAIKYYKLAISFNKNDPSYFYNLGLCYLKKKMTKEALSSFEEAEKVSKEDSQMLESLGEAYASVSQFSKSIDVYNKLLKNNKRNLKVLSHLASIYYEQGDIENAIDSFKKLIELSPASEYARIAYLNLGNIYDELQQFDNSIGAFNKALVINSKDDKALYSLGIAYEHSGAPDKAVESWKKASILNPDNPKPAIAIADFYYKNGNLDEAMDEYQEIARNWPNLDETHFNMGMIYYKKGQNEFAINRFKRVIELDKNKEFVRKSYINLSILQSQNDKDLDALENALNNIKKALLLKPEDPEAFLALGTVFYRKGMLDRAIETYYQAVKNSNDHSQIAQAYNNIGKVHFKKEEFKKALRAFNLALEEDPTNEQIRINRRAASQSYEGNLGE